MNLDDQMEIYKKRTDIMPDEDRIRQTVQASMESFLQSESEKNIVIPLIPVYTVRAYPEKMVGIADGSAGTGMGSPYACTG